MKTFIYIASSLLLVAASVLCAYSQEMTEDKMPGSGTMLYAAIDQHALKAPESVTSSIERLAAYLVRPAQSDDERMRAIYRWVTHNIAYDTSRLTGDVIWNLGAPQVLQHRQALCGGYANLIEAMGKAVGLETVVIVGISKGYAYQKFFSEGQEILHAWNAVRINGQWKLIDATWGSGYLNETGAFVKSFRDYYFFTPPEQFLYDHLPQDSYWQLVDFPISRQEYDRRVLLRPAFFDHRLQIGSHARALIQADRKTEITLFVPDDVLVVSQLLKEDQLMEGTFTFVQRESHLVKINILLNRAGEHTLRIFAKYIDHSGMYEWAVDYTIDSQSSTFGAIGFPERYESFMMRNAFLETPMSGYLKAGEPYQFKIRAPDAQDVAVVAGEIWTPLAKKGDWFEGQAKVEKGEINLCARYAKGSQYEILLVYQGY